MLVIDTVQNRFDAEPKFKNICMTVTPLNKLRNF